MGIFSFIKDAGEKLFGIKPTQADTPTLTADGQEGLNDQAAKAIEKYIGTQSLNVSNIKVSFDGATGKVTVNGIAETQQDAEKVTLCCGNVSNVNSVENKLTITNQGAEGQFHDVVSGDTLSAIAKKFYGDANKYQHIFEANKPMLSHPDKIYPGQKLRIPPLQ